MTHFKLILAAYFALLTMNGLAAEGIASATPYATDAGMEILRQGEMHLMLQLL